MMLLPLIWMSISCGGGRKDAEKIPSRVSIVKGFEEGDSTYSIVDGVSGELIYCSGHNPIELDTVIQGNYIFIEGIITEEFCDRFIVCNPDENQLMIAYFMVWGDYLDQDDFDRLFNENPANLLRTEYLDLDNRKIGIRLFNDKVVARDLLGEKHGNYYLEWNLEESNIIADTVEISANEELIVMNNELYLIVAYKGDKRWWKHISSEDFKEIECPQQYILSKPRSVYTDNDILVIETSMTMFDTDCGYDIEIHISPDGQTKLLHINTDPFLAFSDMIEDIRNDYPGENLCDLVLRMDFYNEAESSAQEYAALYAFCLYNTYEYAWEGFELLLYDMFVKYPEKFDDLHMNLKYLPDNQRQKILKRIMDMLTFEYELRAETSSPPSFRQFVSMFPYFDKPEFEKIYFNPERP